MRLADLAGPALLAATLGAGIGGGVPAFLALPRAEAGDDDVAAAEAMLAKGNASGAAAAFRRLAEAPGGGEDVRVQDGLASALLALGDASGARPALAFLARRRDGASDHARLAEALLASAKEAAERPGARSIEVVPSLDEAIASVGAARAKGPADAPLLRRLALVEGDARFLLRDHAGARRVLADPALAGDAQVQDLLARVAWDAGDFPAAAAAYEAARNPRNAAKAYAAGRDPRAVAAYLALLRAAPADAALADEAREAADRVGALAALGEALAAIPAEGPARLVILRERGRIAETAGKASEAVALYREVLAAAPDEVASKRDLGRALLESAPDDAATVDESVRLLLSVLDVAPDDRWARRSLEYQVVKDATAWREWPATRRLERCVAVCAAIAKADPTDGQAWAALGNARRLLGDREGAARAYDRSIEVNPFDAGAWNDRGLALLAGGDRAGARASFEHAVAVDPADAAPRQNAARLAWLDGDDAAAEAHLAVALRHARALGRKPMLYRFLLDRVTRARARPETR